jgi:hypothetical protein
MIPGRLEIRILTIYEIGVLATIVVHQRETVDIRLLRYGADFIGSGVRM